MKEREETTKQGKTTKKKMWIDITEERICDQHLSKTALLWYKNTKICQK